MDTDQKKISARDRNMFFILLGAALMATLVFVFWPKGTVAGQSATSQFAECLTAKGVTMYGSDTCSNCQIQKDMFADDFKKIHYINCDIHQDECNQKGIQGYPTWMYNSQSLLGVQVFPNLAQFSGCSAPQ